MQTEISLESKTTILHKAWLMWLGLIVFPPFGMFLMWRQRRFTTAKRIVATLIAMAYFLFPIIVVMATTLSLYDNHDQFVESYNNEVIELNLPYTIEDVLKEDRSITSKLDEDITLIENMDDSGAIHELIMVGHGNGSDIVLLIGVLIGMTNQDLNQNEVGQVLVDLRLFDEDFSFQDNETTVEKNTYRYNLKYDQSTGLIFSVSRIN